MPTAPGAPPKPRRNRFTPLLLALLCVGPATAIAEHAPPGPHADLSGWQALLDKYCIRILDKNRLVDTRFDYEQLYVDDGIWTKHASATLAAIRTQLFAVPPTDMSPHERLAWALNAYNFLVVERATLNLLVPGRQFLRYSSVNQIIRGMGGFFEAPVVTIAGRDYSLGTFERTFVYGDSTPLGTRRARAGDPRLRFALCRGCSGGPALAVRAFRADSLDRQLDEATRGALAGTRLVKFDEAVPRLSLDQLLADDPVDFTADGGTLIGFLERFGPSPLRSALHAHRIQAVTLFHQTDWSLNQFPRPKPKAPTAQVAKPN